MISNQVFVDKTSQQLIQTHETWHENDFVTDAALSFCDLPVQMSHFWPLN